MAAAFRSSFGPCALCLECYRDHGERIAHVWQDGSIYPHHAFHERCLVPWIRFNEIPGHALTCPVCRIHIDPDYAFNRERRESAEARRVAEGRRIGNLATSFFQHAVAAVAVGPGAVGAVVTAAVAAGEVGAAVAGEGARTAVELAAFAAVAVGLLATAETGLRVGETAFNRFQLNSTAVFSGMAGGIVIPLAGAVTGVAAGVVMGVSLPAIFATGVTIAGVTAGSLAVYRRLQGG